MDTVQSVRLPRGLRVAACHLDANAVAVAKVRRFLQLPRALADLAPPWASAPVDGRRKLKVPAWFSTVERAIEDADTPLIRIHLGQTTQTGPLAYRDFALDVVEMRPVAREVVGASRLLGPAIFWPRALDDPGRSIFCCTAALSDDLVCDVVRRVGCRYEVVLPNVVIESSARVWVPVERVLPCG